MLLRNISVFLIVLCSFLNASENSVAPAENLCKIKVDLSEISLNRDGMVLANGSVNITSLAFENGFYVATVPKGIVEDILGIWWCYNCQNYNSRFDSACAYCRHPR